MYHEDVLCEARLYAASVPLPLLPLLFGTYVFILCERNVVFTLRSNALYLFIMAQSEISNTFYDAHVDNALQHNFLIVCYNLLIALYTYSYKLS